MAITTSIDLVSIHVAAALGNDTPATMEESVLRPEMIEMFHTQEQNRRLHAAAIDPNTYVITAFPDFSATSALTKTGADTQSSKGPAQRSDAPKKHDNGLDPRYYYS